MEESTNSLKDALKERLSNPFLGKLLLAWIICNWKITYVTFFVSEEKLTINRLDYISDYLNRKDFFGILEIYVAPLLITASLIWIVPHLSDIAFNVSEKFRKKKALKIKQTDEEISNSREILIQNLNDRIKSNEDKNEELTLLAKYLNEERINEDKNDFSELMNQLKSLKRNKNKIERIYLLIEVYNKTSSPKIFTNKLDKNDKLFLIENFILDSEYNGEKLTEFGLYVSKCKLFKKYNWALDPFPVHYI